MRLRNRLAALSCLLALGVEPLFAQEGRADDNDDLAYLAVVEAGIQESLGEAIPEAPQHRVACIAGMAGAYPCSNIDLLEFLPVGTFGAGATNSLWGWTDPLNGTEYVLLGLNNGTAFIDISDPEAPVYVGKLPSHNGIVSSWRDVREYQNHAYVVVDQAGAHGMQVFDLTQLRGVVNPPVTFAETAHYAQVTNVHTLSITRETGYAYLAGSSACGANLHIVNLAAPANPQFAGCYNDDATEPGYVHENQCFVYHGPDATYTGREICLAARGGAHDLDILDATNHAVPVRLSSLHYNDSGYSHQAWFTDDHRYILLNDELDEQNNGTNTRTWIFDAVDLDNPVLAGPNGYFEHSTPAIDHNLYVRGSFVYESNYKAGLRILQLTDLAQAELTEIGFFDVFPGSDSASFDGTWNNYPFFASGVIPVSHISQGLFLVEPTNVCADPDAPTALVAVANGDHRIDLDWSGSGTPGATFAVERALGGCVGAFTTIASGLAAPTFDDLTASGVVTYGYRVREFDASGLCSSAPSACVEESTTGSCTAPPAFAGLVSATTGALPACSVELAWGAATTYCGGPARYSVFRGASESFVPAPGNLVAAGIQGTATTDASPPAGSPSYYVVRATDLASDTVDANLVHRGATATGPVSDGSFATGAEVADPPLDTFAGGSPETPDAPEHAGWSLSEVRKRSGARSFFSTTSNNLCVSLEAGPFALTAGESSQLSFWGVWDIEATYDGGIVQISTNGGASWTTLTPAGGYPDSVTQSGNACAALSAPPSKPAFSSMDQFTWQPKSVDLAAYDGLTVKLAWRYGSDPGVNGEGWYVDDIALTHAQLPGSCTTTAIFIERFEGGDFGGWSLVVP